MKGLRQAPNSVEWQHQKPTQSTYNFLKDSLFSRPICISVLFVLLINAGSQSLTVEAYTLNHFKHSVYLRHPQLFATNADGLNLEYPLDKNSSARSNGSITPERLKKHQSRKKKKRSKRQNLDRTKSLSGDDLATHVSNKYISGGGGILRQATEKRNRQVASSKSYETDPSHKDHVAYLKKLDRHPALVLNADYQPLSVLPLSLWSWQETIKSVFSGKVVVVDVYPDVPVKAVNLEMNLPSVIALTEYVSQPQKRPAFTRRNVFLRDGYRCQYCANIYRTHELSLDHVVPRCVGGKLDWENAVTCCRKCNGRKGSLMPNKISRVGMKLMREPRIPTKFELAAQARNMAPRRGVHSTWKPFLGTNLEPDTDSIQTETPNYFFDEGDSQ